MSGYFLVHRRLLNEHWLSEPHRKRTKLEAWLDLISRAEYDDTTRLWHGRPIKVRRGEFLTSERHLSRRWKWDRKTVSRFLESLEQDDMIRHQSTHQGIHLRIRNYKEYQRPWARAGNDAPTDAPTKAPTEGATMPPQKGPPRPHKEYIPNEVNTPKNETPRAHGASPKGLEVLKHYNDAFATCFGVGAKTLKYIEERLADGASLENMKANIDFVKKEGWTPEHPNQLFARDVYSKLIGRRKQAKHRQEKDRERKEADQHRKSPADTTPDWMAGLIEKRSMS